MAIPHVAWTKVYEEQLARVPEGWATYRVSLEVYTSPLPMGVRDAARMLLVKYLDSARDLVCQLYPSVPPSAIKSAVTYYVCAYFQQVGGTWIFELVYGFAVPPEAHALVAEVLGVDPELAWWEIVIILVAIAVAAVAIAYAAEKLHQYFIASFFKYVEAGAKKIFKALNEIGQEVRAVFLGKNIKITATVAAVFAACGVAGYVLGRQVTKRPLVKETVLGFMERLKRGGAKVRELLVGKG